MRIALFASGNGSNFQAIAEGIKNHKIAGEIGFLFCDKRKALVIKRAQEFNSPVIVFSPEDFCSKEAYEAELLKELKRAKIDLIVLAGYMRIIGPKLLEVFPNKIINIHPSLLPRFPGRFGIREAFEAGVAETGVTIHYVDAGVDTGPIIKQEKVYIEQGETMATLEAKIHKVENRLYPAVLAEILNGK